MILFGPAGLPLTTAGKGHAQGIREVKNLGLDCMEVEFVRGVHLDEKGAKEAGLAAKECGVALTAHAPYYINLCSTDPKKARESAERVLLSARRCGRMGAGSLTFHAAFYQGRDPEAVLSEAAERLREMTAVLDKEGLEVTLRPELTGKPSQLGSLEELTALSLMVPGVEPCIDFSHLVARVSGSGNGYKGFRAALDKLAESLGEAALSQMHMHVSGIEWGPKGEVRHRRLQDSRFRWKALLRALVDARVSGILICESPDKDRDAILLKMEYTRIMRAALE